MHNASPGGQLRGGHHVAMIYYVLNNGVTRHYPKSEVLPGVADRLRSLLPTGGQLPRPFNAFRVETAHLYGGALFILWQETQAVTVSGLAWTHTGADEIWRCLESLYYDVSDRHPACMAADHVPTCPIETPWLGLIFLPASGIAAHGQVAWFGEFTRCLAWSIVLQRSPLIR